MGWDGLAFLIVMIPGMFLGVGKANGFGFAHQAEMRVFLLYRIGYETSLTR